MAYVLLLEPNTLLAKTYTQALTHAGHEVAHVRGAQTAIDAADQRTPDVVVLELQLPGHGGIEFLHEFRTYREWQTVPVVVNTTIPSLRLRTFDTTLRQGLGVVAVLYKPTATLEDLLRAVRVVTVSVS